MRTNKVEQLSQELLTISSTSLVRFIVSIKICPSRIKGEAIAMHGIVKAGIVPKNKIIANDTVSNLNFFPSEILELAKKENCSG